MTEQQMLHSIQLKSRSSIFKKHYINAFKIAGVGPNPITRGSTPPCPNPITSAIGFKLYFLTASSLATIVNEAPSLIPEALPADTVQSALKAGRNLANFSKLVLRGCYLYRIRLHLYEFYK